MRTGIQYDAELSEWSVWCSGQLQGYRGSEVAALELLSEASARYARQMRQTMATYTQMPVLLAAEQYREAWELAA